MSTPTKLNTGVQKAFDTIVQDYPKLLKNATKTTQEAINISQFGLHPVNYTPFKAYLKLLYILKTNLGGMHHCALGMFNEAQITFLKNSIDTMQKLHNQYLRTKNTYYSRLGEEKNLKKRMKSKQRKKDFSNNAGCFLYAHRTFLAEKQSKAAVEARGGTPDSAVSEEAVG